MTPSAWDYAALGLRLDAVTAQVVSRFDEAHVPSLLLKGPALATWLYDPGEVRPYLDIDLLVPPDQCARAREVLTDLGFVHRHAGTRPDERALHAEQWLRAADHTEVDLHLSLPRLGLAPALCWEALSRSTDVITVGGRPTRIPGEGGRALIVVLKAIHDGPSDTRAVDEIARAVTRIPFGTWEQAMRLATELRAVDLFAAGLRLIPEGADVADRLGLPAGASARTSVLGHTAPQETRTAAFRWVRFNEAAGVTGKLRFVLAELLPTRASLQAWTHAADPSLGELGRAYGRRLASALSSAPAGYLLWRRARRPTLALTTRLEVLLWAQLARALIAVVGVNRALEYLDKVPRRRSDTIGAPLAEFGVRRTTCLHRSIGRSQYMRRRHLPHEVVLGVSKSAGSFSAHAWVEPPDPEPEEFRPIHRVAR